MGPIEGRLAWIFGSPRCGRIRRRAIEGVIGPKLVQPGCEV